MSVLRRVMLPQVTTENAEEEEEEEFEQGPEEELVNGQGPRGYFRNIAALLKPEGWLVLRRYEGGRG
eukprot:3351332-Rhodomonas_salina.3